MYFPVCVHTCIDLYNIQCDCVFRMKKKSGVGSRQTSKQQWWWPMTSRSRLSRSCVHSGGSCRRSRIAVQSFLQTLRPCRESGTTSTILFFFFFIPSTPPIPRLPLFRLQFLSLWTQCGYEIPARVLPFPHPMIYTRHTNSNMFSFKHPRISCVRVFQNSYLLPN